VLEMDGLSVLFAVLTAVFVTVVIAMNTLNILGTGSGTGSAQANPNEGFENSSKSTIPLQIRTVLDGMAVPELCPLFDTIRKNMAENERAGQGQGQGTPEEITKRVETALATSIPGGALPCPLLTYPRQGATDLEWLDFLQKIPSDFGARVVLMAVFANQKLKDAKVNVQQALSNIPESFKVQEGFLVCAPDVADSRRLENKGKANANANCSLPENASPQSIQETVSSLLKTLVSNKSAILKSKGIDPSIDIKPLIADARANAEYLNKKRAQAESGTLIPNTY